MKPETKEQSIDDICLYFNISRSQRRTEVYNGDGIKGTQGYEDKGCYDCDGYKTKCPIYINSASVYGVKKK